MDKCTEYNFKDLTGKKFGKLTATKVAGKTKSRGILWIFKCDCGKEIIKQFYEIHKMEQKSCGSIECGGFGYGRFSDYEYVLNACSPYAETTLKYFREMEPLLSSHARKNKFMDRLINELPLIRNRVRRNSYTKQYCHSVALKYKHRSKFMQGSCAVYQKAFKMGWLNEICSHMEPLGNMNRKGIYAIIYSDTKKVYIGNTCNFEQRWKQHMKSTQSIIDANKEEFPKFVKLYDGLLFNAKEALEKEELNRQKYIENGWCVLNKVKCTSLGGSKTLLTFEMCKTEASKHETFADFANAAPDLYSAAHRNNWIRKITQHMTDRRRQKIPIICIESGQEFSSMREAAAVLKISQGNIGMFFKGIRKNVNGYTFIKKIPQK